MYTLQISWELVAIHKIVAASSPGGKWLPCRGNIMDLNRENSTPNHPVLNQTASYLEVAGTNPVSAEFFLQQCKFKYTVWQ